MPHVFISYVRENSEQVLRLRGALADAGVEVWLDHDSILPGTRWRNAIRKAIQGGDFFIACFSKEYEEKGKSYMNEELTLAIEELRLYPTDRAWFIPIILSGSIPDRSISSSETLSHLQWVDLREDWDAGVRRIVSVIKPTPLEVRRLLTALEASDDEIRKRAVCELRDVNDIAVIPALHKCLADKSSAVRLAAFKELNRRNLASIASGNQSDASFKKALMQALHDEHAPMRLFALEALSETGSENLQDAASREALVEAIGDEDLKIRLFALQTLVAIDEEGPRLAGAALSAQGPKTAEETVDALVDPLTGKTGAVLASIFNEINDPIRLRILSTLDRTVYTYRFNHDLKLSEYVTFEGDMGEVPTYEINMLTAIRKHAGEFLQMAINSEHAAVKEKAQRILQQLRI